MTVTMVVVPTAYLTTIMVIATAVAGVVVVMAVHVVALETSALAAGLVQVENDSKRIFALRLP